ncbi:ATXN2_2L [Acanthosepion pharaonis]|uniref:ATXN2_2L n=1 Tax=Acanthosepion pharaonis TaxID=158019 RepID=A0A812CVI0_ACAPH|nr:ATXN2_2L [Sepia pharaonis]
MSAPSKRKGRNNAGGRWRPNQSDQWNMPPRNPSSNQSRNPVDSFKSGKMRIPNDGEGVYGNSRFLYVAMCLIGTPVSIQVKNGNVYEGILVTFSQKMEIILSMAHKVDDRLNPNNNSVIPNKENVIDNLIIKCAEIVKLEAKNVDLDYAVKDTYPEPSSRLNGQLPDKDLTPWEGDIEDGKMTSLESDASNGWDPSDMFKTNYEQFNVKSTYDENLSQYTTPLEKRDTKEYKEREEAAAKLADEIERSDSYKHRISLENGEGEDEEKFAAVIKPEVSNNNAGTGRNPGRKIPNRSGGASLRATPTTSTQQPQLTSAASQQISSSQPQIVQPSHSNYSQQAQSREQQPPQPQSLPLQQPQVSKVNESPVVSPTLESIKVNGTSEKEEKECSTDRSPAVPAESKDTVHATSVSDDCRRNSNTKGERAMEIQALKQFSSNIKLSGDKDKERVEKQERQDKSEERKETEKNKEFEKSDKLSAKVKNSTLNPNAKEFNPKTYPQKHCVQTPPPPRPQTQSPVAISAMQSQQLFAPYIVPMSMQATPQQATNQSNRFATTKRIVPVPRHDFNAQAAAATGQPLLAQTALQAAPYISYFSVPPPTPTPYPQHMMTMTPGSRLTPSVPLVPTSHPGPMEQTGNHQHSAQPVFVAPAGPVPTHVQHHPNHGPMPHPTPTHMGHHPGGGHTQGNQINTQGSGHPAPSPVQTQGPSSQQSQHPQHPPSSGTPQPQPPPPINYQPMSIQGHPPLQGSPHNPTSPPSVHPVSLPYPLPPHSHMQATGAQILNRFSMDIIFRDTLCQGHMSMLLAITLWQHSLLQLFQCPHSQMFIKVRCTFFLYNPKVLQSRPTNRASNKTTGNHKMIKRLC